MILYYAMGGGLGHLVRARAVLHSLGLERDAAILTASPHARDRRVVGDTPVHVAPVEGHRDLAVYRTWLIETLRRLDPREIFVDTFPAGLLGELSGLPALTAARLTYVGRLMRWSAYLGAVPGATTMRFARALLVEPLHEDHAAAVRAMTGDVAAMDLHDPPGGGGDVETASPDLPARFWLVVHSGPEIETAELFAYARELQQLAGASEPIVVTAPGVASGASAGVLRIDVHPASPLMARATRIVSACGFNVMRQTLPFRDRHSFLPLLRRYDDQFTRAARRHLLDSA